MALQKQKLTQYKMMADYWKIISTQHNFLENNVYVTLALFSSQDAKNNGGGYLEFINYTFPGDLNRSSIYVLIKENDEFFSDAEDI